MSDTRIAIREPGTPTQFVDAEELTVAAQTVVRERSQIAGALDVEIVAVVNDTPDSGDYGLVVRQVGAVPVTDNGGSLTVDGTVAVSAVTTSVTPGTSAAHLGKAVNAAFADADTGVAFLAVRNDAGATTFVADQDYSPVAVDAAGRVGIADLGGSITVDGTVTVTDGGGSLTVDNPTLSVVGGGTEATALRVTIATDSTGLVSVDDNGGSLTVDNSTLAVVGGGTEATALRVTLATDSTGLVSVDDNGGSLTIDNAALSVVGGGTEATAQRVTIATDSTGVLSVDDNGSSLTIDGPANRTATGTLGAQDAAVAISAEGAGVVHYEIDSGLSGSTILFQATLDDSNWFTITGLSTTGAVRTLISSFPSQGSFSCGGYSQVRLFVTAYGSGSSSARLEASSGSGIVSIGNPLPAGTATIGSIASIENSLPAGSAAIGSIVSVTTSIVPGTAATHLGKAEDAGHTTGDTGVFILGVRNDTASTSYGANNDYTPIATDANGRVGVCDLGGAISIDDNSSSITIDCTALVPGTAATNLGKAEDAGHTTGDTGVFILGVRNDSGATTYGADQDYYPIATDSAGRVGIADLGGSVTIDCTALVPGTGATNLGKAEDSGHTTGDTGVFVLGVRNDSGGTTYGADQDYCPIAVDANGRVGMADLGGSITVDFLGQFNEDDGHTTADKGVFILGVRNDSPTSRTSGNSDYSPISVDTYGAVQVVGSIAHGSADLSQPPLKLGGYVRQSNPTATATGQMNHLICDDLGRLVTTPFHVRDLVVTQQTTITNSSAETTVLSAGASGVFHDILVFYARTRTATAQTVTVKDATSGTTRAIFGMAATVGDDVNMIMTIPWIQASAANNWTVTLSSNATTVDIFVLAVKNV